MPNRNSSGPSSSGRRGSGRRNSSGKPAGRGKSSGKPFKKSDSENSERRSSSGSGARPSSFGGNKRGGFSKGPRGERPGDNRRERSGENTGDRRSFGKTDKPFRGRKESDSDSRPFRSRKGPEESSRGSFGKSDKPFRARREDSGSERKSFRPRKESGEGSRGRSFGNSDKPFRDRKEGGDSDRKSFRPASAGDSAGDKRKSFRKGDSGPGSFRGRGDSDRRSDDRGEKKSFEKRERPEREERGFFKKSKDRYSEKPKKDFNEEQAPVQTEKIRLNRYIANSGVCSRREADELITMGLISVNGKTVTEMGFKVNPGDEVRYESKLLKAEKPVYILLNKPKGFLTTTDDPQERKTVMQLIGSAVKERIYPVGRLDRNTTGLLLLTNDGDLADKLMHPSYNIKKIYKVELDRPLTKNDFQTITEGVVLEEGRAMVDDLAIVSEDGKTVGVEIHIGWNRVVRRIFETLGYNVIRLDRSVYAGLDKKDLGRGEWRFLTKEELVRLKHYK